jgi:hypothetical protein
MPRNYTVPLPVPGVEDNLRNTIYDPYVRRVVWEGLLPGGMWDKDIPGWLLCPSASNGSPMRKGLQRIFGRNDAPGDEFDDSAVCPFHWASEIHPLNCEIVWPKELDVPEHRSALDFEGSDGGCGNHQEITDDHDLEARSADPVGRPRFPPKYIELNTPAYAGTIAERRIVEKLMAMGGIRLAAILNWLFVDPEALAERKLWVRPVAQ